MLIVGMIPTTVFAGDPVENTAPAVDVSLTFDKDYAEYGEDGGADLVISASISGKKVTEAQISVSLTDEEAAMLNVSEMENVSLDNNQLKVTLNNDESSGNVSFNASIPVRAESLSSLEITKEDISVSVLPEQYQGSPLVKLNLTGDKLTFVEKLPEDSEYGSGTAYAAQVEAVTVHFADSEGKATSRQETAPVFTLYYQIEGEEPAALQEGNLPFGLDEIPEISVEAGQDTWTGRAKDAGTLPSTVLVLEDGVCVEKEVNWFLKPSYPEDYYENNALDTREFTLTNKLNDTTDVSWYTLWLDNYAYQEGSRPDIYLNIYARIHNADGTTQTQLVIRNYRWEFEGDGSNPDITHQNFWKCTIENLPKYDSLGYEIDYFAVMDSVVSAGDFDYLPTSYAPGTAKDSSEIFATADGALEGVTEHLDQIVNVSGDSGGASYALMSGNTFVNIIYDTVTFSGEKLWTNLPDEYPLADLPSVTFTLSRSIEGGSEESDIARMTIDGEDWQNLNVNGHYVFVFGHTGKNEPASSFNKDVVPSGETLLPRFDDKGRLYTYTLKETIDWTGTDAEEAEETDGIFASSSSGQTFTNRYQDSCIYHSIRIKKLLRVPAGQEVYPAFGFKLTRTYTTDEGEPSAPEFVMRTSYNADEVKSRVKVAAGNAAQGQMVTAEFTVWFSDLAVYAPNGSKYTYTVTEENTSELGGFDTWVAKGDYSNSKWEWVKRDGEESSEFTELVPKQHNNDKSDVTFLNETQEEPATIQLTGKKIWKDLDDSFRPDVTEGLEITLKRRANAQTGQNNAIGWEEVDITDSIKITWNEESEDSWSYTITGLERYAPNGMPWIYQVTEEPVNYYTAVSDGVASQYSQDSDTEDTILMNDLTNTMYTSTSFKKTWVDSDGRTVTENLLGSGIELEVSYELQVRAKEETGSGDNPWSAWQKAQVYFGNFNELAGRTYSGSIRRALGDSAWNQSYRGTDNSFNNLPTYVKDSAGTIYALEYRVVETGVKVWRNGQVLLTQTYTAPVDNGNDNYAYTVNTISGGAGGVSLFAPYYGAGKNEQPNNTTNHKNQIETAAITVSKEWRGDHNEVYETRPATDADRYDWEVTLAILRSTDGGKQWDPTPVKTVTLYGTNEEDRKEATVSGLPAFVFDTEGNLQECAYSVRELQSEKAAGGAADREQLETGDTFNESYTVSYSDNGLTAVNTLNSTEFQGEKVWNDEEETHGDITLELKYLKTGGNPEDPAAYESFVPAAEVQLGEGKAQTNPGSLLYYAEEDWTAVWKEVPLRLADSEGDEDGNTIYRIFETETDGYIAESTAEDGTTTITNTPSVTPGVTEHWLGVPAAQNVTVTLYRKTAVNTLKEEAATAVLTADKNWSHTFEPQPKYDDHGDAYEYWVEETLIDGQDAAEAAGTGGYAISCGGDAERGFHIYNNKVDNVYVIKEWADVSDAENRPEELQLTLQRTTSTDPKESDWQTVTDVSYTWNKKDDRWETSFAGLPQYDTESGLAYTYRVEETVPAGYEQTILSSKDGIFHFKNTRSELIDIPVEKVWDDNGDKLGYRPDTVRVELYADGCPTGKILELKPGIFQSVWNSLTGSSAGWSGVFKDQPRYDDTGRQIVYSVVETQAPEHYQISYSQKQDGTQVVTNTANGRLTVTKQVTGSGDRDAEFHFTVQLSDRTLNGTFGEMIFQDGVATFALRHGESVTAADLPAGITYMVTEKEADEGAYLTQSSKEIGQIQPGDTTEAVFINDLNRISISVTMLWKDNDDQNGKRPGEVVVMLLADGKETGKTLVLHEGDGWKESFRDLDEYQSGKKIIYTVEEKAVDGYETAISGNAETGFTITNTYMSESSGTSGTSGTSGSSESSESLGTSVENPSQTGDETNLTFWIIMCCVGILGFIVAYFAKKRLK